MFEINSKTLYQDILGIEEAMAKIKLISCRK